MTSDNLGYIIICSSSNSSRSSSSSNSGVIIISYVIGLFVTQIHQHIKTLYFRLNLCSCTVT